MMKIFLLMSLFFCSGVITVAKILDRETTDNYALSLSVFDRSSDLVCE